MTNELMVQDDSLTKVLAIWQEPEQLTKVRQMFAPKLSNDEFEIYVQMGIACALNPFLREIWAIKYDDKSPAQIFIGRDGYRKIISRNANYDGHIVDAVFSNDTFEVDLVKKYVRHIPNFKDRGKLIGAYCIVYMKNSSIPHYVFAEVNEYNTGKSSWSQKPATMIKKVAEAQAIRMADQTCSSTYSPEEVPDNMVGDYSPKAAQLNKDLNVYEGEKVNVETGEVISAQMPDAGVASPFNYDEIKKMMENAKQLNELHEAASLISGIPISKEQRSELSTIYRKRIEEVKKLEG